MDLGLAQGAAGAVVECVLDGPGEVGADTTGRVRIGWTEFGQFKIIDDVKAMAGGFTTHSDFEDCSNEYSSRLFSVR